MALFDAVRTTREIDYDAGDEIPALIINWIIRAFRFGVAYSLFFFLKTNLRGRFHLFGRRSLQLLLQSQDLRLSLRQSSLKFCHTDAAAVYALEEEVFNLSHFLSTLFFDFMLFTKNVIQSFEPLLQYRKTLKHHHSNEQ